MQGWLVEGVMWWSLVLWRVHASMVVAVLMGLWYGRLGVVPAEVEMHLFP